MQRCSPRQSSDQSTTGFPARSYRLMPATRLREGDLLERRIFAMGGRGPARTDQPSNRRTLARLPEQIRRPEVGGDLVADEFAETVGEDRREADRAFAALAADAGQEPPDQAPVWEHGTADTRPRGGERVGCGRQAIRAKERSGRVGV
jgi:hypothetical protein